VPRAGLTGDDVVASAAGLADEIGFSGVTMGLLADRLGVRPPSLYKHVGGLADVQHRLATLAMTELGEVIRDALQARAGRDALAAMLTAVRAYVSAHPGRYAATIGAEFTGPDDPLSASSTAVCGPRELAGQPRAAQAAADHRQVGPVPRLAVEEGPDPPGEVGPPLGAERDHPAVRAEQPDQLVLGHRQ